MLSWWIAKIIIKPSFGNLIVGKGRGIADFPSLRVKTFISPEART